MLPAVSIKYMVKRDEISSAGKAQTAGGNM